MNLKSLNQLSSQELRQAADIQEQIEKLTKAFHDIFYVVEQPKPLAEAVSPSPKSRRKMSAEARARIGAAMKKRWRKAHANGKLHL